MAATALIRGVPRSFDRALVREGMPRIDVDLASAQHDGYRSHLQAAGYVIESVPADEDHPDCVFIEDTAVIVGTMAVITRPGAPTRRGETGPVARALSARFPLVEIESPGTVDGGDVIRLHRHLYIGRSTRTNEAGIDQLSEVAIGQELGVTVVEVTDVLHLKSAVLPIDQETVVVTPNTVDEKALGALRIVYEAGSERHRFSALPMRDGRVLVTAAAPQTTEMVAGLGHQVTPIDVSEIQAADGGLTCMSILFE